MEVQGPAQAQGSVAALGQPPGQVAIMDLLDPLSLPPSIPAAYAGKPRVDPAQHASAAQRLGRSHAHRPMAATRFAYLRNHGEKAESPKNFAGCCTNVCAAVGFQQILASVSYQVSASAVAATQQRPRRAYLASYEQAKVVGAA
eukprot:COSAG01_NODE_17461_length_1149_cov_8.575238_2_plen_144_part_00